jgi:hypothetical protein
MEGKTEDAYPSFSCIYHLLSFFVPIIVVDVAMKGVLLVFTSYIS